MLNHVYEGLVRYTGDLKIEPALAESGDGVADDLALQAAPGRRSSANGNPFTADDVHRLAERG